MITRKIGPGQGELVLIAPAVRGGPARGQQPGLRDRDRGLPDRHLAEPEPGLHRCGGGQDRRDGIRPRRTNRPRQHRVRHHPVNTARTASTRPAKRRNQPRTVSAGRRSSAAISRCPAPVAFAVNPAPITAAVSARRTSNTTGSSTCVARQPVQRARRGTIHNPPSVSRTRRPRA
jgi:hypothetical protein